MNIDFFSTPPQDVLGKKLDFFEPPSPHDHPPHEELKKTNPLISIVKYIESIDTVSSFKNFDVQDLFPYMSQSPLYIIISLVCHNVKGSDFIPSKDM